MPDFVKEGVIDPQDADEALVAADKAVSALEMQNMLRYEEDKLGAILEINSGAGGTESCDWVNMLYRMYTRYFDKNDYKYEIDGEFVANNFRQNTLKHEKGVVSLVRADYTKQMQTLVSESYNSGSSQFTILTKIRNRY